MDKSILDVKGAASILGVSKYTIYRLIAKNILPSTKIGKQYRFHRTTLIQWLSVGNKTNQLECLLKTIRIRKK